MVRKNAVIVSFAIFFGNIVEKVKNKNVPRFNENMIKLMKSKNIVKKCLKKIWSVWGGVLLGIVLGLVFGRTLEDLILLVCGGSISGGVVVMISNIFCETVRNFRENPTFFNFIASVFIGLWLVLIFIALEQLWRIVFF